MLWSACAKSARLFLPRYVAITSVSHAKRSISSNGLRFALPSHWGTKKQHRQVKVVVDAAHSSGAQRNAEQEATLKQMRNSIRQQGDVVRQLKAALGSQATDVQQAVAELKARKKCLEDAEEQFSDSVVAFDRFRLEDLLRRRFFYDQSFAIYGGVTGQYDFGPMGCALLGNLLAAWRNWFVHADRMLEVDCTVLTPEAVLKASGHVDRFVDVLVRDLETGDCFRLDHLLKNYFANLIQTTVPTSEARTNYVNIVNTLDAMTKDEMQQLLTTHDIRSPITGNRLSESVDFNLMFKTNVSTNETNERYLRPETAQGVFVNYERLLRHNRGRLPFATAQIGTAFRNEIAPRSGLLRVREFTMAEIEHFCAPNDRQQRHAKFVDVSAVAIRLYAASDQMAGRAPVERTIGEAVNEALVSNETLGYYLARTQQFLLAVGLKADRIRFRQHLRTEMAHYARDCWDAEVLTSYGWIECVGCADRSAYDIQQHAKATQSPGDPGNGDTVVTPNVIEPSFGIGRIMYAILEHSFAIRNDDEQRSFLSLPPLVAPFKCSILPLSTNVADFRPVIESIGQSLRDCGIFHREDSSSGSIGRRYARTDEIGIPFAITVDFETVSKEPQTVTLRDRDSMEQLRVAVADVAGIVGQLSTGRLTWSALKKNGGEQLTETVTKPDVSKIINMPDARSTDREFVYQPSFAMYGAQNGQYDLGPLGCALKSHILNIWNEFFVIADGMLPMKCSVLTPEHVLSDNNNVGELLSTSLGPAGTMKAYLRGDALLGVLVNFKRLLEFNAGKLPFAVAHVGNVFRKKKLAASTDIDRELCRTYEFAVADFVHFGDPRAIGRTHSKFPASDSLMACTNEGEIDGASNRTIGELLETKCISSETFGYLLHRIHAYLQAIGIPSHRIRYRQRLTDRLSDKAIIDSWDAEILTASGDWINCVTLSDRASNDLLHHSRATGVKLTAEVPLSMPVPIDFLQVQPNRSALRKAYKKQAKSLSEQLADLGQSDAEELRLKIASNEAFYLDGCALTGEMVQVQTMQKMQHVEEIVPRVLHGSFGVARLLHILLDIWKVGGNRA